MNVCCSLRQKICTKNNMATAEASGAFVRVEGSEPGCDEESQRQEEAKENPFSEPWEDSDLILVVENNKFHVHRLFLSINSPVFKAMFKSQFKEATSLELPLPEKKPNELVDFLKQIYLPYIKEKVEITMENVEHLLKLSDEYQVKLIFDPCIEFVKRQSITLENVMKLLSFAELYGLDDVNQTCNNFLKDLRLKTLSETVHLEDLDLKTARHFLEQRIVRLEAFLDRLYPYCQRTAPVYDIYVNDVSFTSVVADFQKVMPRT